MTRNTECSALARLRNIACVAEAEGVGGGGGGQKREGEKGISRGEYIFILQGARKLPSSMVFERYIELALPY